MKASDMLDLLHYYLEEDMFANSQDLQARNSIRTHIYRDFYNVDYDAPGGDTDTDTGYEPTRNADGLYVGDDLDADEPVQPVNPRARQAASADTKPYIPPTEFDHDADDPFASALSPEAVRRMRSR